MYRNASDSPGLQPSPNSTLSPAPSCFVSSPGSSIFTAFTATNVLLLLPLSIFILTFGLRQACKGGAASPIDVFTYNMVAMEMVGMGASVSCCCGSYLGDGRMLAVGCNTFAIISCVKMFFHVLTCVERYLAVVRPVTYLRLSGSGGVPIRNASVAGVWLLCCGLLALRFALADNFNLILFFCNLISSLFIISFCSLSVLRVLSRPGPGEGGGTKSKQRALVTMAAILGVLLTRFGGNLVCQALAAASVLGRPAGCAAQVSGIWFCLPSSYVLPLLFLHRAAPPPCCRSGSQ